MAWTDILIGLFVTGITAAITPFTVNYLSGIILTIKNKYADTPEFDIGSVFEWSFLPTSGSQFPTCILVSKSLTKCKFLDLRKDGKNGLFSVSKFRWMISSGALIYKYDLEVVNTLMDIYLDQVKTRNKQHFNTDFRQIGKKLFKSKTCPTCGYDLLI